LKGERAIQIGPILAWSAARLAKFAEMATVTMSWGIRCLNWSLISGRFGGCFSLPVSPDAGVGLSLDDHDPTATRSAARHEIARPRRKFFGGQGHCSPPPNPESDRIWIGSSVTNGNERLEVQALPAN
jgi:hypothetical protein